jgi:predicted CXXCH cytochrome family protein
VGQLKRWALLIAGGAIWLFLLAIPVFADGGPHVSTQNSGSTTLASDNCAGCHRAHTAQAELLLKQEVPDLCLACHGASGLGATTNVEDGVQYALAQDGSRTDTLLGASRAGGFVNARIGSSTPSRLSYQRTSTSVSFLPKVPVLSSGQAVTSVHMDIDNITQGTAWGNIPGTPGVTFSSSANAGGTMTLNCTSCHNPHGNNNYRILKPIPGNEATGGTFAVAPTPINVTDAPLPSPGDVRNYTVIQIKGTEGTPGTYLLYAGQLGPYSAEAGDYFHRRVPWNSSTGANDAPNGLPTTFNGQINAWCSQCHSRYLAITPAPYETNSGDAIFTYRHSNTSNKPCTTCHVAHGSNAQMTGFNSTHQNWPGGGADPSADEDTDSRLLKVDNRGTCQMCHDPTGTVPAGVYNGPTPSPGWISGQHSGTGTME